MITSKIAANQAFAQVNRMHKVDDPSRQRQGSDEAIKTTKGETIDGIKAEISSFSANPSHQFTAEFNAVVKSIRIADKAMGEIETNIEQMESEVEMFLKQYPPYPPGSEDRVNYLSRFALLRKQIDQLTFPPDTGAQNIIGRSQNDQSSDWEIEIGGKQIGRTIRTTACAYRQKRFGTAGDFDSIDRSTGYGYAKSARFCAAKSSIASQ
jgi:hypothetical protein